MVNKNKQIFENNKWNKCRHKIIHEKCKKITVIT